MSIHIKDREDLKIKLNDAGDQLVVVYFFATWCGKCKRISPQVDQLAVSMPYILVLKVDVDESMDLDEEYALRSLPTFIFIKKNEVISKVRGQNYPKLKKTIEDLAK